MEQIDKGYIDGSYYIISPYNSWKKEIYRIRYSIKYFLLLRKISGCMPACLHALNILMLKVKKDLDASIYNKWHNIGKSPCT